MKYEKEYYMADDKKEFILLLRKKKVKKSSADRAYYRLKHKLPNKKSLSSEIIEDKYSEQYKIIDEKNMLFPERKVDMITIIMVRDMMRLKVKITEEYLLKYGIFRDEYNWMKNRGIL